MSYECYCDYEPNEFYSAYERKARKPHKCGECFKSIPVGEVYEYVSAKCDGAMWDSKTCARCLALRKYVEAHLPCFCRMHGSVLDDADEAMKEYAHQVPGMRMEYGRLRVAVNRGPQASR